MNVSDWLRVQPIKDYLNEENYFSHSRSGLDFYLYCNECNKLRNCMYLNTNCTDGKDSF